MAEKISLELQGRRRACYYIFMGGSWPYVTCTYSDGEIRTWHQDERGYSAAKSRALGSRGEDLGLYVESRIR